MNATLLLVPLILIRYGFLYLLSGSAFKRAAFIPSMPGGKKVIYWIYQISTLLLIVYPCFLKIKIEMPLFAAGLVLYSIGTIICVIATAHFAKTAGNKIMTKGLYRVSRNPMYVAYFIYFSGCALLVRSWILLIILAVFQISTHWIILAEENWCKEQFGEEFITYMKKVRRYI